MMRALTLSILQRRKAEKHKTTITHLFGNCSHQGTELSLSLSLSNSNSNSFFPNTTPSTASSNFTDSGIASDISYGSDLTSARTFPPPLSPELLRAETRKFTWQRSCCDCEDNRTRIRKWNGYLCLKPRQWFRFWAEISGGVLGVNDREESRALALMVLESEQFIAERELEDF